MSGMCEVRVNLTVEKLYGSSILINHKLYFMLGLCLNQFSFKKIYNNHEHYHFFKQIKI